MINILGALILQMEFLCFTFYIKIVQKKKAEIFRNRNQKGIFCHGFLTYKGYFLTATTNRLM